MILDAPMTGGIGSVPYEFVFKGEARSVHVAGTFNGWSRFVHPLRRGRSGDWSLRLRIPIGRHLYKLVLNGENWILDPRAADSETDRDGNVNSILAAFPQDYAASAKVGDGRIAASTLHHEARAPYLWVEKGRVQISLAVRPGDARRVNLVLGGRRLPMRPAGRSEWVEMRRAEVPLKNLSYSFEIEDGGTRLRLGANGISTTGPVERFSVDRGDLAGMSFPTWPQGAVFYQIFPDRFANGSKANDPADVQPWSADPSYHNWFGGDAKGVAEKMPYLKALGIQGIYFNPIFAGPSNHRYETEDYFRIDPRFGSNKEFRDLTLKLDKAGIKTVMDGVFNHTATSHPAFRSLLKEQGQSRFRDWFFVRSFPVSTQGRPTYEAWNGFGSMPKVNLSNREARRHMLSVLPFWAKNAKIHGWRLDVAGEVQMDFWREFRTTLKAIDPQSWIVGEVWTDGSPWLGGDQWDSIMGYQFRGETLKFIARGESKPSEYLDGLMRIFSSVAPPVGHSLMNLLSSHDTPRFLTECGGSRELAQLGATMLLTWPGSPSIYYGDEILMAGGADPANRRGMEWDKAVSSNTTLQHYRKLISLRRSHRALSHGTPVKLGNWDNQGVLAFGRAKGSRRVVVAVNRSTKTQTVSIPLPSSWRKWSRQPLRDVLGHAPVTRLRSGEIRMTLAPLSGAIAAPRSRA